MKFHVNVDEEDFNKVFKTITSNVKHYRKAKGLSQEQLALEIGHSSASMISKIEAHLENKHYSIKQLYLISKVLDVPMEEFFKGIE